MCKGTHLIVVAHPDDEVLGAGGTIFKLTQAGYKVNLLILSAEVSARSSQPKPEEVLSDIKLSSEVLGIGRSIIGNFPNIEFNNVPHIEIVRFIEQAIIETEPEVVITHWPLDANNDHMHTALACQSAIRIFQRRSNVKPVEELLFMEVQSATDWIINPAVSSFYPNTYIEIGQTGIEKKLEALRKYRDVTRQFPHPRSLEAITGLAAYRAGQCGLYYAESFVSAFRRIILDKPSIPTKK